MSVELPPGYVILHVLGRPVLAIDSYGCALNWTAEEAAARAREHAAQIAAEATEDLEELLHTTERQLADALERNAALVSAAEHGGIEVVGCTGEGNTPACPFMYDYMCCNHPGGADVEIPARGRPGNCPLIAGPIAIRLKVTT